MQGRRPCPRSAERGILLCLFKRRRGSKGEPSPGVPPFFLWVCTCAPLRWEVVVGLSCRSTPFLWCLPKETVSSRQRKALFLPWRLHHSRERYCLGYLYSSSPDLGRGWCWSGAWCGCADTLGGGDGLSCNSTPFLWCLPKETVSSRQRKALFYPGGSTIRVSATASVIFTHLRPTWGGAGAGRGLGAGAPIRWEVVATLPCDSTPFLWCLPKETVSSRQRKALFYPGGSTIRVSATASVIFTHLRPTWGGAGGHLSGCLRRGRTGFVMAALRGQSTARASLSLSGSAHLQKRVSLGLHPVSLRKSKEMGWNWQQGAAAFDRGTAHTYRHK